MMGDLVALHMEIEVHTGVFLGASKLLVGLVVGYAVGTGLLAGIEWIRRERRAAYWRAKIRD